MILQLNQLPRPLVEYHGFFRRVSLLSMHRRLIIVVELVRHFGHVIHWIHLIEHRWKLVFMMGKKQTQICETDKPGERKNKRKLQSFIVLVWKMQYTYIYIISYLFALMSNRRQRLLSSICIVLLSRFSFLWFNVFGLCLHSSIVHHSISIC